MHNFCKYMEEEIKYKIYDPFILLKILHIYILYNIYLIYIYNIYLLRNIYIYYLANVNNLGGKTEHFVDICKYLLMCTRYDVHFSILINNIAIICSNLRCRGNNFKCDVYILLLLLLDV